MFTFLLDFLIGRIAESTFWLIEFFVKLSRSDDPLGKSTITRIARGQCRVRDAAPPVNHVRRRSTMLAFSTFIASPQTHHLAAYRRSQAPSLTGTDARPVSFRLKFARAKERSRAEHRSTHGALRLTGDKK
jgi:hypothetical protein